MDYIVISGSSGWAGRYEFDMAESVETLTVREWGWIKKLAGYLPTDFYDGLRGADAEVITTLAVIALYRHGKVDKEAVPDVFERLADSPYDAITIEFGEDVETEGDAGPPPTSASGNGSTSGADSLASSETLVLPPSRSGSPRSVSSPSAPPTLGT